MNRQHMFAQCGYPVIEWERFKRMMGMIRMCDLTMWIYESKLIDVTPMVIRHEFNGYKPLEEIWVDICLN